MKEDDQEVGQGRDIPLAFIAIVEREGEGVKSIIKTSQSMDAAVVSGELACLAERILKGGY